MRNDPDVAKTGGRCVGASPRPPSGEDTSRRRRADTDDETSIFATLVGGEPPASHAWRSVDARGV
ncbi:MAG: hypothetical protein U1A07_19700, partial [Phenylobacterium sp.]|nr:hypothetical protein [Phenylobacterium sp.]